MKKNYDQDSLEILREVHVDEITVDKIDEWRVEQYQRIFGQGKIRWRLLGKI